MKLILMMPGNPSPPGVYQPFLTFLKKSIEAESYGKVEFLEFPHLGQCNLTESKYESITLNDVIQDHALNIKKTIEEKRPTEIYWIAHSLGNAITLCLYEEFKPIINKFIFICPFLNPEGNNKTFLKFFKNSITRNVYLNTVKLMLKNHYLSQLLIKTWLGNSELNDHLLQEVKKTHYLDNLFKLLSNYIDDFSNIDLLSDLNQVCPEKSHFIFAEKDFWVPLKFIDYLPQNASYCVYSNIDHDFCLYREDYEFVANEIKPFFV